MEGPGGRDQPLISNPQTLPAMRYTSDFSRRERLNALLVKLLSELIQSKSKDPRIEGVTVTGADISPDLRSARIYVSILGDEAKKREAIAGLCSAAPYYRSALGKMMRAKRTPELHFSYDPSLETGAKMEEILADLDIPEPPVDENG